MTTSDSTPSEPADDREEPVDRDERDEDDADAPGRPWRRILGALTVAAVLVGCAPFVWSLVSTSADRHSAATVPDRPVALVLGAGVRSDGHPTLLLARRLDTAADLYFDGRVQAILVSGDNSVEHYNEPDTMRGYLVAAGVPEEHVVADYAGFSTWDSCARANEVFGVEAATVVTQDFHLPRAVGLCRTAGIDAVGVADSSLRERTAATVYGWLREVPATAAAFLTMALRPDPVFLGEYESGVDDALAAA
ncbi:SanA/YdcF family protein [Nocardiopsis sp. EMB25]|uniref:SanA/YdcF family protein n=2 Tax=Nocardiopsis TaxID=2013 RepID=UPI002E0FDE50